MFTLITQGSFKSTGAAVDIPLPSSADYFVTFNETQAATTATPGVGFKFEWFGNPATANDSAFEWKKSDGTNVANMVQVTSGGFTYVTALPTPQPQFVGTAISHTTGVASGFSGLPYSNGDRVILYNTVGMETIGGMFFTVSSVSSSQFTLIGLQNVLGIDATAVSARRISHFNAVLPEFAYVTAVSQAAQAVVTLTTDPADSFYVGQKVVFQIPSSFGMVQLNTNNLPGTQDLPIVVTAINSTNYTITVNINSTNFTAFTFPAATGSPTAPLFATVAPAGSSTQYDPVAQTFTGYNFNKQPFRSGQFIPYMHLAAGAQSPAGQTNDVILWQAYKMEATTYGNGT